jgi:hypothetical protein
MNNQFTLIISSSNNDNYSINFRCWILNSEGNQETIDSKVDNGITLQESIDKQNEFIQKNK